MHTGQAAPIGRSVERIEDAALLTGRGRYIDDLGAEPGTLHAAILRSPHAHAAIVSINNRDDHDDGEDQRLTAPPAVRARSSFRGRCDEG